MAKCGVANYWLEGCTQECGHCQCCGDVTDGLFPLTDELGNHWCEPCWENEKIPEEDWKYNTYKTSIPDICYRHEYDEDWYQLIEKIELEAYGDED